MLTPSIWTQVAAYVGCANVEEALPALCELGWRCFELSTEHLQIIEDAADRPAAIERTRALLVRLEAAMPQAHALLTADVLHADPVRRAADVDRLERNLRTCAALGVQTVVLHPGQGRGYTTRRQYRQLAEDNRTQIGRLADLAGELGLRLAVENMADGPRGAGRRFGAMPWELIDLLEAMGRPNVGVCLDTSHAHMQGLDVAEAAAELGPLTIATHLSDNDGSGDQHKTPGYGKIDWPAVMAALLGAGYRGTLNLEIPGENCPSPQVVRWKVRQALEITQRLAALAAG